MFHSNTRRLIDYWRARRTARGEAPSRAAIDPVGFSDLLPQVFILGRHAPGDWRFRLAGGMIVDLHGREVRGEDGLRLWPAQQRLRLSACLEAARRRGQAFVATARGSAGIGRSVELELLFAPLSAHPGQTERCLGLYQPLTPLAHLAAQPLDRFELLDVASADEEGALPSLHLAVLDGRRIA